MGLFKKKQPVSASVDFIGRKFSSGLNIDECIENFSNAAAQCYPVNGEVVDVAWNPPVDVTAIPSSQGGPAAVPPARFVALDLVGNGRLYLAVWDGYVGSGGDGESGGSREMWFVPPGFDGSPIPIAGTWKGLDGSLSSIGAVEPAFWGA